MDNLHLLAIQIWFEGQKVDIGNQSVLFTFLVGGALAAFALGFFSRKAGIIASVACLIVVPVLFGWLATSMATGIAGSLWFGVAVGLFGAVVGVIGLPRDLLVSTFVAIASVGAVLTLLNGQQEVQQVADEAPPVLEVIEMPTVPPDEPEPVESTEVAEKTPTYTPMLADVPSAVTLNDFVQPMQPPPPPNQPSVTGVVEIPQTRTNVGASLGNVFNLSDLDQIPQPTFQPPPQYPYEMKRAGINGQVTVGFIVDTTGAVRDAYVVSSSHTEFEAAALAAIQKWRFRPGRKRGAAVNTRMQQPLTFKLTDSR